MFLRHVPAIAVVLLIFSLSAAVAGRSDQPPQGPAATQPGTTRPSDDRSPAQAYQPAKHARSVPVRDVALYTARSKDGLQFEPDLAPLIRSASSPTLIRLSDERLLLVCERLAGTDRSGVARLAFSVSSDAGRTWSEPRPLIVQGLPKDAGAPRSPALTAHPDGQILLYTLCRDRRGRRTVLAAEVRLRDEETSQTTSRPAEPDAARHSPTDVAPPDRVQRPLARLTTAVCRVLDRAQLARRPVLLDDLIVAWIDQECHLYGTFADLPGRRYHGTSSDGRRFRQLENLLIADVGTGGSMVKTPTIFRLYGASRTGVVSAVSQDGKTWSRESGVRLPGADDSAVVRLADDSWYLVYAKNQSASRSRLDTDRDERAASEVRQGESAQADGGGTADDSPAAAGAEAQDGPASETAGSDQRPNEEDGGSGAGEEATPGASDVGESGENGMPPDDEGDPLMPPEAIPDEFGKPGEAAADDASFQGFEYTDFGIPIPDFVHRVDYLAWFEAQHDPCSVPDNAWDYYAALMFDPEKGPLGGSAMPLLTGMFSTAGFTGPPAPWSPTEHPEWEEAYNIAAPYLAKYAEAATHSDYVRPVLIRQDSPDDQTAHDGEMNKLLIGIMLPDLSAHRALAKQTLSDAWRAPDGKPDPQVMLNAFDTCLGSADHLGNSDTLIERLVSISEKALVEKNARYALQHGVFSPDEMESALDVFIERNQPMPEPSEWISGETAMSLDTTQYLFGVGEEGGGRTLKPERIEKLREIFGGGDETMKPPTPEELATTTAEQVAQNFIDFADHYARMAGRGYPEVRANDLDEMTRQYAENNYVSRFMLPSLSRVYQLVNRQEASRRATQLSYAIHLHKARTGQWPQSLDELPPRYTQGARTDPFSGQDFRYRPTDDGFTLYSTSENGLDDGGTHHIRWNDENKDDPTDDYVFWPPQ